MSGTQVPEDVVSEDWTAVAFHTEKTQARRIAARTGIGFDDALQQILAATALPRSFAELVSERQHDMAQQAARRTLRKQQQVMALQLKQVALCPSPMQWHAWFDGSASPNPGTICVGGVLRSPEGEVAEISRDGGIGDSSEAEYLALIAVLELAKRQQVKNLVVFGDSRIVIDDITGMHVVPVLTEHRRQAHYLRQCIGDVVFRWIPRAKNSRADGLASRRAK